MSRLLGGSENGCKATNNNKGSHTTGYVTTDSDFDFKDTSFSGRIDKCTWARSKRVNWDGVSNRNIC